MKRDIYQAESDALGRMCKAVRRAARLESRADREQANRWARAWQDKYLSLSRIVRTASSMQRARRDGS